MILGNVVPPFPLKVHFITFGITFLLICLFLAQYQSKKWILYFTLFYFVLQLFLNGFHLKDFIDFFFGPFVFLSLIDLLFNNRLEKATLWKYQKRFFMLLWIPMLISFLQFIELFPLTFWNATYINYSEVNGALTPRANGFLYHGSELSVIIFFVAVKQFIRKSKYFFVISIFILVIAYGTYYKALTITILLLIIYYYTVVNPLKLFKWTNRLFRKDKILYLITFLLSLVGLTLVVYKTQIQSTKELFSPQLLTGRGAIWNVYLQAVSNFSFWEYFFGAGIGSESTLFQKSATPELYFPLKVNPNTDLTPDAHNAIFTLFLNAGILGILFYFLLFKIIYTKIAQNLYLKKLVFPLFIMYILPIGITITLYKKAVLWIALGFLLHYFWIKTNSKKTDES
ncbi:MAG: hypothetical protein CMC96_13005 [Flavobacteriales bacterium]|nr:hypothetical protein [Flavobacteriales bacterium]|tara:strand:+ start:7332 stop:8525 length:1194 start_codon:yes stop_codon:yes gene_type:complete